MGVRYGFGLAESLLGELAGVSQYQLQTDVEAMIAAAEAVKPLAKRLGVPAQAPHLAGFAYSHASAIGCEIVMAPDALEPACRPCLHSPKDIDRLREPKDYLSAGIVPKRLALAAELKRRRPDASDGIGHDYEGPVTTAALMMGQDFFMLPYDDPQRARRLLEFVTRSAINYARTLRAHQGRPIDGGGQGICDDFAGIFGPELFGEFVVPYWNMLYEGLRAEKRFLHSELLREGHMKFLADVKLDEYDPSVDQYLPAEVLKRSCPMPWTQRIWPSEVRDCSAAELVAMYRHRASFKPTIITFALANMSELEKIEALLAVARELA